MVSTCRPQQCPAPECECGCGQPTSWQPSNHRYSRFVDGHQNIGRPSARRISRGEPPLCGCGCGAPVKTFRYGGKGWATHLVGHTPKRPHTEASKALMREKAQARDISGSKNPCWRGGIKQETYRNHPSRQNPSGYLETTARVRLRDGDRCILCGSTVRLDCHHVDGDIENNADNNLATLCHPCHMRAEFSKQAPEYKVRVLAYMATIIDSP